MGIEAFAAYLRLILTSITLSERVGLGCRFGLFRANSGKLSESS